MQEIVGKNTQQTIEKVASFLKVGFDKVSLGEQVFDRTINDQLFRLLPYYARFTKEDGFEYDGVMGLVTHSILEVSGKTYGCYTLVPRELISSFIGDSNFYLILVGHSQKETLRYLVDNPHKLDILIKHFNAYYEALHVRMNVLKKYDVNERDVLEYFRSHKRHYKIFRDYMECEISVVKQYAPHIVETWKHYQSFLELDA